MNGTGINIVEGVRSLERRIDRALARHGVSSRQFPGLSNQLAWELLDAGKITPSEAVYCPEWERVEGLVVRFLENNGIGRLTLPLEAYPPPLLSRESLTSPHRPGGGVARNQPPPKLIPQRAEFRPGTAIFGLVELIVPSRLSHEEIGDALEVLDQLKDTHAPRWRLYLKVTSTVFWLIINVLRELFSVLTGKRRT